MNKHNLNQFRAFLQKSQRMVVRFWRRTVDLAEDITNLIGFINAIKPYLPKIIWIVRWVLILLVPNFLEPPEL